MDEIHDFDDTVVAVLDDSEAAARVTDALSAVGYEYEVLRGTEGKEHLDVAGESGPGATIKRLMNVFGDQYRVLEKLHRELDAGKTVVSVDAKPDEATEAVRILQENKGEFIWKLGTWTFTHIGEGES